MKKNPLDAEPPKQGARVVYRLDVYIQRVDINGNRKVEQFSHRFDGNSSIDNRMKSISRFISYRDIFVDAKEAGVDNVVCSEKAEDEKLTDCVSFNLDLIFIAPNGNKQWLFSCPNTKDVMIYDLIAEYKTYLQLGYEIRDTIKVDWFGEPACILGGIDDIVALGDSDS